MAKTMWAQMGPFSLAGVYYRYNGRLTIRWALPAIQEPDGTWVTPTLTDTELKVRAAKLGLSLSYYQGDDDDAEDSH